jgi:hypothetical protein
LTEGIVGGGERSDGFCRYNFALPDGARLQLGWEEGGGSGSTHPLVRVNGVEWERETTGGTVTVDGDSALVEIGVFGGSVNINFNVLE